MLGLERSQVGVPDRKSIFPDQNERTRGASGRSKLHSLEIRINAQKSGHERTKNYPDHRAFMSKLSCVHYTEKHDLLGCSADPLR